MAAAAVIDNKNILTETPRDEIVRICACTVISDWGRMHAIPNYNMLYQPVYYIMSYNELCAHGNAEIIHNS